MDFNYLKKKLNRSNLTIDDVAIFFAFDNIDKYEDGYVDGILKSLNIDLELSFSKNKEVIDLLDDEINVDLFTTLIEKMLSEEERKSSGSYYTMPQTVRHMVNQSLKLNLLNELGDNLTLNLFKKDTIEDYMKSSTKFYEILLNNSLTKRDARKIFDVLMNTRILEPSSGAGIFIYYSIKFIDHVSKGLASTFAFEYSIGGIIKNVYANDINSRALSLSKLIPVHFLISESIKTLNKNINYINRNWTNINFIEFSDEKKYNIIIGNPPYLETKDNRYFKNESNLYSMFIRKILEIKTDKTVMTFVIPNSFQTTPKYKRLRGDVLSESSLLFIESYNDRPASLFSGVHQRLNIVHAMFGVGSRLFTTEHMFHRKSEIKDLFNNVTYFENESFDKLASKVDKKIMESISQGEVNLLSLVKESSEKLLISSRLGLWPKCFVNEYQSKEVMEFSVSSKYIYSLAAIFNSSTFYFYWISSSDAWHVTKGNISGFMFPKKLLLNKELNEAGKKLLDELEKTKLFVNTSQVQYEYKHRLHKQAIDEIDEIIMKEMNFSLKQYKRIIGFAEYYRMAKWR